MIVLIGLVIILIVDILLILTLIKKRKRIKDVYLFFSVGGLLFVLIGTVLLILCLSFFAR